MKKDSQAFINDMNAKEKAWKAERENGAQRDNNSMMTSSEQQVDGEDEAASVDLSDIKSENASIYWEQKRGNVEDVDIMINQSKLFDDQFYSEFNEGLRLLEQCMEAPLRTIQELLPSQDA